MDSPLRLERLLAASTSYSLHERRNNVKEYARISAESEAVATKHTTRKRSRLVNRAAWPAPVCPLIRLQGRHNRSIRANRSADGFTNAKRAAYLPAASSPSQVFAASIAEASK
jgi:hypothetical protein